MAERSSSLSLLFLNVYKMRSNTLSQAISIWVSSGKTKNQSNTVNTNDKQKCKTRIIFIKNAPKFIQYDILTIATCNVGEADKYILLNVFHTAVKKKTEYLLWDVSAS